MGVRSSSAIAWTPTSRARRRPAWTRRSCLTGAAARAEAEAAKDPTPVAVADTLAALVLDGAEP